MNQMGAGMGSEPTVTLDPTLAVGAGDGGGAGPTDDQILDQPLPGQAQDGDQGGDQGQDGSGDGQQDGQQDGQRAAEAGKGKELAEEDKPLDEVVVSPELKKLFDLPGVGGQVRNAVYTLAGYREVFPTVAAARAVSTLIPTPDAARAAVEARDTMEVYDDLFYSADRAKHGEFVTRLFTDDPQAASSVAVQAFDALATHDPAAYRQAADQLFLTALSNLHRDAAENPDDERMQNRIKAFDVVSYALFKKPLEQMMRTGFKPDPKTEQLSARERAIQAREQEAENATMATFHKGANEAAVGSIIGSISAAVQKLITSSNYKVSEQAQRKLVGEVYSKIDAALKADRDLRSNMRRIFKDGARDDAHKQRVVEALGRAARAKMRETVKGVFDDWTNNVLGLNKGRQDRQRQAASRTDIDGGRPVARQNGGTSTQGVTHERVDYGRTSEDDILNGKVTLRR